jgi:cytochrome c556
MVRTVLAVAVVALAATALVAQTDPIKARKDLMEANGKQSKAGNDMVQGKQPFNLDAAKKVFAAFQEAGEKEPALFPDTSKTGGKTAALPAIWENNADFDARFAKLASDSKAAIEATKDLDTFKAQFTEVTKNCGGCHQVYRKKET